jgi:hypothetical protein
MELIREIEETWRRSGRGVVVENNWKLVGAETEVDIENEESAPAWGRHHLPPANR